MTSTILTLARLAMVPAVLIWLDAPAEAQRRNPNSGGRSDTPREGSSTPAPRPRAVPRSDPAPSPRASEPAPSPRRGEPDSDSGRDSASTGGRDRGSKPAIGEAVPRTEPPRTGDGDTVIISRGYGGYGYPYGGYGYGGYGYGGYGYGGYYDPYGGYARYPFYFDEGKLRLKIKPRDAAVYVDGYYVGVVDDFDGIFQRLRLEAGFHRIEIQEPGFEPLILDVRIDPDRTTTFRGTLRKMP